MNKRRVSIISIIIVVFIIALIAISVYFVIRKKLTKGNVDLDSNSIGNDENIEETDNHLNYTNSIIGVSFYYPNTFFKYKDNTVKDISTISFTDSNQTKEISLEVKKLSDNTNYEALLSTSNLTFSKEEEIIINGLQGIYYEYSSESYIYNQIYLIKDSTLYTFTYKASQIEFNYEESSKVISSFKLIDTSLDTNYRTSTKDNPVNINQWTSTSKFNSSTSSNQELKVRVTNIILGQEANSIYKEFADESPYYEYEEPKENEEWIIIEYEMDFSDFDIPSYGISPYLTTAIQGIGDSSFVKINDISYIVRTIRIGESTLTTSRSVSNSFAFKIEKGFSDYVITFGELESTYGYIIVK